MPILSWETLYNKALQSEPNGLLDAHRIAVEAIFQRLFFLDFGAIPLTVANTREKRALYLALSDLRVLRTAFSALP
jgi:hypothetical protein